MMLERGGRPSSKSTYFGLAAAALLSFSSGSLWMIYTQCIMVQKHLDFQPPVVQPNEDKDETQQPTVRPKNNKNGHSNYRLLSDDLLGSTNLSSWSPLVFSTCDTSWMPKLYAPCLVIDGETTKQELVYPDFKLHIPNFATKQGKELWLSSLHTVVDRFQLVGEWGVYRGQHGQNIVYNGGGTYTGMPTSGWHPHTCMAKEVNHHTIHQEDSKSAEAETVIIVSSPDIQFFQHFLDRGTHIILQAEPHFTNTTKAWLGNKSPEPMVNQILNGLSLQQYGYAGTLSASKQMIFSCRAPLIHPYLSLRLLELLHIHPVPIQQRKIILYVGRKHSKNGGRAILNENDLLKKIRQLLDSRNKNETLVEFDHTNWETFSDMIPFFSQVSAVVGPHGGAFFNHRWTGRDTLVMEFIPKNRLSYMFWEEASILSQNYWAFPLHATGRDDMTVPTDQVVDVLSRQLGKPLDVPTVDHYYPWIMKG